MRKSWFAKTVRAATALRLNGGQDTGHVVRAVLRITDGPQSAVDREVEVHLTASEARSFAEELLVKAETAEKINRAAGYRIDRPRF